MRLWAYERKKRIVMMKKRYKEGQPLFYVDANFDTLHLNTVFRIQECVVEDIIDEVAYIRNKDTGVKTRHNVIHSDYTKFFFSRREAEDFIKKQQSNEENL